MKKALALTLVLGISVFMVIACGGGGGGGSKSLSTGTFTRTVALGTNSSWTAPISDNELVHEQLLYFPEDISGNGHIESISFQYGQDEPSSSTCPDFNLLLGHTNLSTLSTTFADNVETGHGALETVLAGPISVPAGSSGDYMTIPFETPFNYNGADNLIVEIVRSSACGTDIRFEADSSIYTDVTLHIWNDTSLTGSLFDEVLSTKFNFAGGDNAQVYGGTTSNAFPFTTLLKRVQNLVLASEIDGTGPITGVAYQLNENSVAGTYTYSATLGHTTLSALGATYADNYDSGSPVLVADNATFAIPAGMSAGEWFWLPIPDGSFTYNGTDNFIVDVGVTAATAVNDIRISNLTGSRRVYGDVANAVVDTDNRMANLKLRFNGGTMDVITDGSQDAYNIPIGWPDDSIVQLLYDNTALGTSGQITGLSIRFGADKAAADYDDLNLVLGHTSMSALGSTFAGNIESDLTVAFSGSLSIPTALKAGDWFTIPFSTPFIYDSTKNLVVQWDWAGGAANLDTIGHTQGTGRYENHTSGHGSDRTATNASSIWDLTIDMSLTVDK